MTASTYKSSGGEAYPVKVGETWEVGNHVLHCSDLMAGGSFDELLADQPRQPDVLYADPPWTPAMVTGYQIKAGLEKGAYDWAELHGRILSLVGVRTPCWIEGSVREADSLQRLLLRGINWVFPITYYGNRAAVLHYDGEVEAPDGPPLQGADDEDTPGLVLARYPVGLVVDPVGGRGLTARHAARRGWHSLTNELSPWRMSAALYSLGKQTGLTPHRID